MHNRRNDRLRLKLRAEVIEEDAQDIFASAGITISLQILNSLNN